MPETICMERRKTAPHLIIGLFVLFVGVRLFLPVVMNDSMGFYSATTWAVIEQQNWGKQVLAGVMEYSPLPAVLMIILAPLGRISFLNINVATILVAVSQAGAFCLLFILLGEFTRRLWFRGIMAALAFVSIGIGVGYWVPGLYLFQADPFWVLVFPFCLLLLFASRIGRLNSLRPVLGYSLACGMLLFAGPAGIIVAFAALMALVLGGRDELSAEGGTTLLALMPFIYGLILHLLFNLVIMGDLFFSLKRLWPYFQHNGPELLRSWRIGLGILWGLAAVASLIIIAKVPFFVRFAWAVGFACVPVFLIRRCGSIFLGGEFLIYGVITLSLLIAVFILLTRGGIKLKVGMSAILVSLVFLMSATMLRRYSLMNQPYLNQPRPTREQLTSFIDRDWVGSRVLVFGARPATLYCVTESNDPKIRERFIGSIDFNINVVSEHMEKEQLHILVPPDNGVYYPRGDNFFSKLYRDDEPNWLHLETVIDGWQLWRCVRQLPQKGSL